MQFKNKLTQKRLVIRRGLLLLIMATVTVLLFQSCRRGELYDTTGDRASLNRWLDTDRTSPGEIIQEVFESGRSVVLAQDTALRGDTVLLMRALVPTVRSAGVSRLGVYFLDSQKQEEIDAFVVGEESEVTAAELLFESDAALGYREYSDFLVYVREFNLQSKSGEAPFRLIALGEQGKVSTERINGLLSPGIPGTDEKTSGPVFLWITMNDMADSVLPSDQTGNPLPLIAVHHGPDKNSLRWDGFIETVASERDIRDRTFGFLGNEAPFSMWKGNEAGVSADIYLVTPFRYMSVTPIADFVSAGTAEAALEFFPEISMKKPLSLVAIKMNHMIRRNARRYQRELNRLDVPVE